jgi:hypothetical protein
MAQRKQLFLLQKNYNLHLHEFILLVTRDQKLELVDYPNTPNNKKKIEYLVAKVVEIL